MAGQSGESLSYIVSGSQEAKQEGKDYWGMRLVGRKTEVRRLTK